MNPGGALCEPHARSYEFKGVSLLRKKFQTHENSYANTKDEYCLDTFDSEL